MLFLIMGVIGIALKFFEIGPFATTSWFIILAPFALAVAWWAWADASGYTKRKEIEKMAAGKTARENQRREKIGLPPLGKTRR